MKWLVVTALAAGCSLDLTGVYRVDSDVTSAPCGADQPVAMPSPYIKFVKDDFLGNTSWEYDDCTDASATTCMPTGGFLGLFGTFSESIDNGYQGNETTSSYSGTTCDLTFDNDTVTLNGSALVIDLAHYEASDATLSQAQCTTDEAGKRGTSMPCTQHEHLDATKQ